MKEPERLISDDLEFVSAMWFFSSVNAGNMLWDTVFGETIKSMNGEQECGNGKLQNKDAANCRFKYFECFEEKLKRNTKTKDINAWNLEVFHHLSLL